MLLSKPKRTAVNPCFYLNSHQHSILPTSACKEILTRTRDINTHKRTKNSNMKNTRKTSCISKTLTTDTISSKNYAFWTSEFRIITFSFCFFSLKTKKTCHKKAIWFIKCVARFVFSFVFSFVLFFWWIFEIKFLIDCKWRLQSKFSSSNVKITKSPANDKIWFAGYLC